MKLDPGRRHRAEVRPTCRDELIQLGAEFRRQRGEQRSSDNLLEEDSPDQATVPWRKGEWHLELMALDILLEEHARRKRAHQLVTGVVGKQPLDHDVRKWLELEAGTLDGGGRVGGETIAFRERRVQRRQAVRVARLDIDPRRVLLNLRAKRWKRREDISLTLQGFVQLLEPLRDRSQLPRDDLVIVSQLFAEALEP